MPLYQHAGIAVAFSPRLRALLAEAAHHARHLAGRLSLVHAGEATPEKAARMADALAAAGLPTDTPVHWATGGSPDDAILRVVAQHGMDVLLAGALEKEQPLRYFLGSVARNLVREAAGSLVLLTTPNERPEPLRRIVAVTDFSERAFVACAKALRFAEASGAERVHVLRVMSEYGEAMALAEGVRRERAQTYEARTLAEERALLADFVDSLGRSRVPVEAHCLEGKPGLVASALARDQRADLLVIPAGAPHTHFLERVFPSDMEWILREIPCNLWVAREPGL